MESGESLQKNNGISGNGFALSDVRTFMQGFVWTGEKWHNENARRRDTYWFYPLRRSDTLRPLLLQDVGSEKCECNPLAKSPPLFLRQWTFAAGRPFPSQTPHCTLHEKWNVNSCFLAMWSTAACLSHTTVVVIVSSTRPQSYPLHQEAYVDGRAAWTPVFASLLSRRSITFKRSF